MPIQAFSLAIELGVVYCPLFFTCLGLALNDLDIDGIGMTSRRTRARMVSRLQDQGIQNLQVLGIMEKTPRHCFLDEALAHRAYEDTALPIGFGQTLSQPYIVARMTELLLEHQPSPKKLLEIGTGSGYQTAVLAQLVSQIWTLERIAALQLKARQRLDKLKLYNVRYRHADGGLGWQESAPYDAILAAAAPSQVPKELLQQLAPNGILIIPVGQDTAQQLVLVKREGATEEFRKTFIEPVRFVPLLPGLAR